MTQTLKDYGSLTASTLLTGSAVALGTLQADNYNQVSLLVNYTTGAAETNNTVVIQLEGSNDGVTFYRLPAESVSSGTVTLSLREYQFVGASAGTSYKFTIEIPVNYLFLRVSAYESGVAANYGTVALDYYASSLV